MKKLSLLLISVLLLTACTSQTEFGKCIGITDEENPALKYRVSVWNLFLGIVFIELIYPPIKVAVDQFKCPYERR